MLKSSLFILFCETGADFHQIATFILKLAVYSRHTVLFLDLNYSCRTLFYDTFDKTLLSWSRHQNVVPLAQLGCKGNIKSSCFHMFIVRILCFLNNIMQDLRKWYTLSWPHSAMTQDHDLRHF